MALWKSMAWSITIQWLCCFKISCKNKPKNVNISIIIEKIVYIQSFWSIKMLVKVVLFRKLLVYIFKKNSVMKFLFMKIFVLKNARKMFVRKLCCSPSFIRGWDNVQYFVFSWVPVRIIHGYRTGINCGAAVCQANVSFEPAATAVMIFALVFCHESFSSLK